jgi:hypothetical protein
MRSRSEAECWEQVSDDEGGAAAWRGVVLGQQVTGHTNEQYSTIHSSFYLVRTMYVKLSTYVPTPTMLRRIMQG